MSSFVGKFHLEISEDAYLMMPQNSMVLSVDVQESGTLQLWAIIDAKQKKMIRRNFYIAGTGQPLPERISSNDSSVKFIGTALDRNLGLVWHVWMV